MSATIKITLTRAEILKGDTAVRAILTERGLDVRTMTKPPVSVGNGSLEYTGHRLTKTDVRGE